MNDEVNEEEFGLLADDTDKIQAILDELLKDKLYDDKTSAQMINDILERVMETLHSFGKPYKYIADCVLSQRVGAGFTNSNSAVVDKSMDNVYNIYYPKEKTVNTGKDKPLIFALVTIFVVSF